MKLAEELIEALSSEKASLTEALLKTKVLLHKIGQKELVDWVNDELNGYPESAELPAYRVLPAQVLANIVNPGWQATGHPIPLHHLTDEQREGLEKSKMRESLAVLEKLGAKDHGRLQAPIPMEFNGILAKGLSHGWKIQRAWCEIQPSAISGIFVQVRSRLLDFLLGINEKLPNDLGDAEMRKRSHEIDAAGMFKNAVFGDNVTVVVGAHNAPTVSNVNVKGDFAALANQLREHKVADADISNLERAVQQDEGKADERAKQFGPAVKKWLSKMLSKAVDTSWQIELGVASNLLTTALQNYYGWLK